MRWMIRYVKLRFGVLLWSIGTVLNGSFFYWGYKNFSRIKDLELYLTRTTDVLKRALTWKVEDFFLPDKLPEFSQELKKYAMHFDTLQVTYKKPFVGEAWIEMTITFKIQHDDIFWNFFKALYTRYKGRIESVTLTLSRGEAEASDYDASSPHFSEDEALKNWINGVYKARYYFFNAER
ncbi:hypothetical protein [Holospora curviuscula]|uniref:hypothetical protein n=1 Tax=Holospora curviuscula TaxID=1082868 RepID=UPI001A9C9597|nr:hypothetical protein [Holospora curviuscula]